MSESRASRGRPKGSGLDDRARLVAVAELMAGNPDLRPTTAIRSTGVTDPSTIRRLRDKFHEMRAELAAELAPAASRDSKPTAASVPTAVPATRPAAAKRASAPTKKSAAVAEAAPVAAPVQQAGAAPPTASAPPAPAVPAQVQAAAPAAPAIAPNPAAWFSLWYGFGLQSLTTAATFQVQFLEKVMRMPHVATALRGQVAFNEMALAFCATRDNPLKTLH